MFQINNGAGRGFDGATEGGSIFENLLIQMEDEVDSKIYNWPEEACDRCARQNNLVIFMRMWYESIFGHTSFDLTALLFKFFHSLLKAKARLEKMALAYWKGTVFDYPKAIELLRPLENVLPSTGIEAKLSQLHVMTCWVALSSFFSWLFAIDRSWVFVLRFFVSLLQIGNNFVFVVIRDSFWPMSLMSWWAAKMVQWGGLRHAVTFTVVTDDIVRIVVVII